MNGLWRGMLRPAYSQGRAWLNPAGAGWTGGVAGNVSRRSMFIQTQTTPNANAVKFIPGEKVLSSSAHRAEFTSLSEAAKSPLARKLLVVDGVRSVFFGGDFITVTKDNASDWALLRPELFEAIMDHYTSGDPTMAEGEEVENDCTINPDDSEVVCMIKELIETRVKPAVAEDGGNIIYRHFDEETGIVDLEMQGACSSCSSSSVTLKNGVENMLKHYVPEVVGVREVTSEQTENIEQVNAQVMSDLEAKLRDKGYIRD